eukprot:5800047-Amphidinium_carterae.1
MQSTIPGGTIPWPKHLQEASGSSATEGGSAKLPKESPFRGKTFCNAELAGRMSTQGLQSAA